MTTKDELKASNQSAKFWELEQPEIMETRSATIQRPSALSCICATIGANATAATAWARELASTLQRCTTSRT